MDYLKVDIVIAHSYLRELITLLESLGVTSYTVLEITHTKKAGGHERLAEGLLSVTRSSLLFTIASEKLTKTIIEKVQPYLTDRDGFLIAYPVSYVGAAPT